MIFLYFAVVIFPIQRAEPFYTESAGKSLFCHPINFIGSTSLFTIEIFPCRKNEFSERPYSMQRAEPFLSAESKYFAIFFRHVNFLCRSHRHYFYLSQKSQVKIIFICSSILHIYNLTILSIYCICSKQHRTSRDKCRI